MSFLGRLKNLFNIPQPSPLVISIDSKMLTEMGLAPVETVGPNQLIHNALTAPTHRELEERFAQIDHETLQQVDMNQFTTHKRRSQVFFIKDGHYSVTKSYSSDELKKEFQLQEKKKFQTPKEALEYFKKRNFREQVLKDVLRGLCQFVDEEGEWRYGYIDSSSNNPNKTHFKVKLESDGSYLSHNNIPTNPIWLADELDNQNKTEHQNTIDKDIEQYFGKELASFFWRYAIQSAFLLDFYTKFPRYIANFENYRAAHTSKFIKNKKDPEAISLVEKSQYTLIQDPKSNQLGSPCFEFNQTRRLIPSKDGTVTIERSAEIKLLDMSPAQLKALCRIPFIRPYLEQQIKEKTNFTLWVFNAFLFYISFGLIATKTLSEQNILNNLQIAMMQAKVEIDFQVSQQLTSKYSSDENTAFQSLQENKTQYLNILAEIKTHCMDEEADPLINNARQYFFKSMCQKRIASLNNNNQYELALDIAKMIGQEISTIAKPEDMTPLGPVHFHLRT